MLEVGNSFRYLYDSHLFNIICIFFISTGTEEAVSIDDIFSDKEFQAENNYVQVSDLVQIYRLVIIEALRWYKRVK